ncbi:MAG: hypothetical protein NZR01_15600 [Bryobacteraceae bacterium]|nr:hypothetical protein [Bryobacteraceae bacterium]
MSAPPEELVDHIVTHLGEEQPELIAELGDAEVRRRVVAGIGRAHSHRFVQPEAVTAYVTLMFLVAPDFDQHPAIARALRLHGSEGDRLRLLFQRTREEDWEEAAASSKGWSAVLAEP